MFTLIQRTRVVGFLVSPTPMGRDSAFAKSWILSHQRPAWLHLPRRGASVTGIVYEAPVTDDDTKNSDHSYPTPPPPKITLFTKEGCTLCDKVKDVLMALRHTHPHTLEQVDITDEAHADWLDRYKYDIPVLHFNGKYWAKHRISVADAQEGFERAAAAAASGQEPRMVATIPSLGEEPNAGEMERKAAERKPSTAP